MEWHSVYSCYAFEATRLRVTKYRTSTIDVNRTDIGSLRKHPFLPISDGDVSRETSPAAKSEEKRMFSQAMISGNIFQFGSSSQFPHVRESKTVLNTRLYAVDSAGLSQ